MKRTPITVFFSYSHRDEALRDELANHLEILKMGGEITDWHDRRIIPGDEWDREIKESLNSAQIILLLISSDFIASRYCRDIEVTRAMERHEAGEARVIPIILRSCLWSSAPFGKLQALPKNAIPVTNTTTWPTQDDAFTNIAEGIKRSANEVRQKLEDARLDDYKAIPRRDSKQHIHKNPPSKTDRSSFEKAIFTVLKKTGILQAATVAVWLVAAHSLREVTQRDIVNALFLSGSVAGIISGIIEGISLKVLDKTIGIEEVIFRYTLVGLVVGGIVWSVLGYPLRNHLMVSSNGYLIGLISGLSVVLVTVFHFYKENRYSK